MRVFTLPCRGRVGARSEPGWGPAPLIKTGPHPDASLTLGIDPPPAGEGEDEGAPDSTLHFRRKSFVAACAPSAALLSQRGPPHPRSGGG